MHRRYFLSFVAAIAIVAAVPAMAAEIQTSSQIDAVTVYPDGATVTRLIRLDLPAGDSTLLAHDLPRSIARPVVAARRRRGRRPPGHRRGRCPPAAAGAAGQPAADRPPDRGAAGSSARRSMARSRPQRRAASSPSVSPRCRLAGLGEKGEARPVQRMARCVRGRRRGDRHRRQHGPRCQDQAARPRPRVRPALRPSATSPARKLEVRIDLNADAAAPVMLRVTYAVRGARWTPVYDARLDTGGKDRKPSLELIRRAEIVRPPARTGPTLRSRFRPCAPRTAAARPICGR